MTEQLTQRIQKSLSEVEKFNPELVERLAESALSLLVRSGVISEKEIDEAKTKGNEGLEELLARKQIENDSQN